MFHFVRGLLGQAELIETYRESLERIISGDYTQGNIKKLQGHHVYRLKLGVAERLLFTTIEMDGETHLLVLDYLPTHDYHKSRFLRPGVLARYKERLTEEAAAEASAGAEQFVELDSLDPFVGLRPAAHGGVVDFYQNRWISLDASQNDALSVQLPAVVSGVAGSGKSCVALMSLLNHVSPLEGADGHPVRLLYVAQNPLLVAQMRAAWHEMAGATGREGCVEFKSYQDLFESGTKFATFEHFETWFSDYIKLKKRQARAQADKSLGYFPEARVLYEEFRLCSAYDEEAYKRLGEKRSLVVGRALRQRIYEALKSYQLHLADRGLIDINLHHLAPCAPYSCVVIDEAQDFSHRQIMSLTECAQGRQVLCFMDSHQRLNDRLSIHPFLLEYLGIGKHSGSHVELCRTYRCAPRVTEVANCVMTFGRHLSGGFADKHEARYLASLRLEGRGVVHVTTPAELKEKAWSRTRGVNFAVVTTESNKARARAQFGATLVYTPEEIKGLEYETILAYELYDKDLFAQVYKRWQAVSESQSGTGRATDDVGNSFNCPFNKLYVAYTRATNRLIICESPSREKAVLIDKLMPFSEALPDTLEQAVDDDRVWEEELKRNILLNNLEQARLIFELCLKRGPGAFEAYKDEVLARESRTRFPSALPESSTADMVQPLNRTLEKTPAAAIVRGAAPSGQKTPSKRVAEVSATSGDSVTLCAVGEGTRREQLTSKVIQEKYSEEILVQLLTAEGLRIEHVLLGRHQTSQESLLAWILKDETRTQIFVQSLLHEPKLFHAPFLSAPSFRAIFSSKEFLEFRESCLKHMRSSKLNVSHMHPLALFVSLDGKLSSKLVRQYHALGGNLNLPLENTNALALAVDFENTQMVSTLIALGVDPTKWDANGRSPIHKAALHHSISVMETMLLAGVNMNAQSIEGDTPLFHAVASKNMGVIKLLLADKRAVALRADINIPENKGATPLYIAAQEQNLELVKLLIAAGANLDQATYLGATALYIAAQNGSVEIVRTLASAGANLNLAKNDSLTPLIVAIGNRHIRVIQALISAGVNIDKPTSDGTTALYAASSCGFVDVVRILIEAGADVNLARYHGGATPLYIGAANGHVEVVKMLHEAGAQVNQPMSDGFTPIFISAAQGRIEVVKFLISLGVDINSTILNGATPLYIASYNGHVETVNLLIDSGARIDSILSDGVTPLFIAAERGCLDVVNILIGRGANPNQKTSAGDTPLVRALTNGHIQVARVLLRAGAIFEADSQDGMNFSALAAEPPELIDRALSLVWGSQNSLFRGTSQSGSNSDLSTPHSQIRP